MPSAAVIRKFRITAADGKNYETAHYNLDVIIAKNYLTPEELNALNRIVVAYLELAEVQALNHQPMYMRDWLVGGLGAIPELLQYQCFVNSWQRQIRQFPATAPAIC